MPSPSSSRAAFVLAIFVRSQPLARSRSVTSSYGRRSLPARMVSVVSAIGSPRCAWCVVRMIVRLPASGPLVTGQVRKVRQQLHHMLRRLHIEVRKRLIQQQQLRVALHHPRQRRPLPHPLRVLPHGRFSCGSSPTARSAISGLPVQAAAIPGSLSGKVAQVLHRRKLVVEHRRVAHIGDPSALPSSSPAAFAEGRTVPRDGEISPATMRSSVDLPAPFSPRIMVQLPGLERDRDVPQRGKRCRTPSRPRAAQPPCALGPESACFVSD
jgi:hypothetical protein